MFRGSKGVLYIGYLTAMYVHSVDQLTPSVQYSFHCLFMTMPKSPTHAMFIVLNLLFMYTIWINSIYICVYISRIDDVTDFFDYSVILCSTHCCENNNLAYLRVWATSSRCSNAHETHLDATWSWYSCAIHSWLE